jgi:UDP-N-acetylglucosamine--N-acetylmuramyl-(pentapeptide) pyrophosphoryl-undecaprenol N-acetylglucosamine transferase
MTLRVLAAAGDSAGHVGHACVVLDALATTRAIDAAVVLPRDSAFRGVAEGRGWRVEAVGTTLGIRRELSAATAARRFGPLAWSTVRALGEARRLLDRWSPDVVVGTGGRCSLPTVLAAALRGIPTVTVPHWDVRRTNRMLAYAVTRTCLAREDDRARFPAFLQRRLRVTGTPLRPEAYAPLPRPEARARLALDPARPTVGLVGYSRGSPAFAGFAAETARRLAAGGAQVVVQHGAQPVPALDGVPGVLARPFFDDLPAVFAACDVVASAGGETTLLELCAAGVPSLCLSLDDTPIGPHIRVLAEGLERAGASVYVPAARTEPGHVATLLGALLADAPRRAAMARAGRAAVAPEAAARVLVALEEALAERAAGAIPAAVPTALRVEA